MTDFNTDANQTAQISFNMENHIFITLAKIDHIVYKTKAYAAILNENHTEEFSNHTTCRLGKWYAEGIGKERFSCTKSYPLINEPHKIVHDSVHDNMDVLASGGGFQPHEIEPMVENFRKMEDASKQLFTLLNKLPEEKCNQ